MDDIAPGRVRPVSWHTALRFGLLVTAAAVLTGCTASVRIGPFGSPGETPCELVDRRSGDSVTGAEPPSGSKVDLSALLLTAGPPGYSLYSNHSMDYSLAVRGHAAFAGHWARFLREHDYQRGWRRIYARGQKTLLTEVLEFASPADARSVQRDANALTCSVSQEGFVLPGAPGSIGLRYSFEGGRLVEQVSFVVGTRRYVVLMSAYNKYPQRNDVISFTQTAMERATQSVITICDQVESLLPQPPRALGVTKDLLLEKALPESAPAGLAITHDEDLSARDVAEALGHIDAEGLLRDGFSGARHRQWESPEHYLSAFVIELRSSKAAQALQERHAHIGCRRADGWFGVNAVDGSVGMEYGYPFGPQDLVTFVRGPRLFAVKMTSSSAPPVDILNEFVDDFSTRVTRSR